jgi:hypothetical protein
MGKNGSPLCSCDCCLLQQIRVTTIRRRIAGNVVPKGCQPLKCIANFNSAYDAPYIWQKATERIENKYCMLSSVMY